VVVVAVVVVIIVVVVPVVAVVAAVVLVGAVVRIAPVRSVMVVCGVVVTFGKREGVMAKCHCWCMRRPSGLEARQGCKRGSKEKRGQVGETGIEPETTIQIRDRSAPTPRKSRDGHFITASPHRRFSKRLLITPPPIALNAIQFAGAQDSCYQNFM
jgi:hypothetical protein